jgi:uncharacterized protein
MSSYRLLILLVSNPSEGNGLSQLSAEIGEKKAGEVYMHLLAHHLQCSFPIDADKAVFYSDFIDDKDVWKKSGYKQFLQEGKDPGLKIINAFNQAFSKGYSRVIVIGTESFEMNTELLDEAFDKLDENEVVIGPSLKNDYYLIGLNSMQKELFLDKNWGEDNLFLDTVLDIKKLKLKYQILKTLNKVVNLEDLQPYRKLLNL